MLLNRLTNSRELPNDGLGLDNAYIKATRVKVELLGECMVGTRDLALLEQPVRDSIRWVVTIVFHFGVPTLIRALICPGTSQGRPGF